MSNYLTLKAELATLDLSIELALAKEKARAVSEIQAKMEEWQIPLRDLQQTPGDRQARVTKSHAPAPRYRDPASGATWSGRGRMPAWIAGRDRSEFEIE